MEGWRPVAELTRWGFAHAQVVMANEAHDGLRRCVRTREVGIRMIRVAHEAGVRRLAMEALPWPAEGNPGPIRVIPPGHGGYLAQPEMRRLISTALELGWTLWAYDAVIQVTGDADPAELLSLEFTNWREREQAQNLCHLLAAAPAEPLLVWSGNSHASKQAAGEWIPMGCHFTALAGMEAFVIDQTVSIDWRGRSRSWLPGLLATLGPDLAAWGGTAGILRAQAPPPLDNRTGVDAVVVSTDNTLT